MNDPQIIKTPNGEELVVLPRADYEALLAAATDAAEDAGDVAIYDACMAGLQAGKTEILPAEVSAFITRGDSLLKALRKWRGMSQINLARRTNLGQGYLSDIESRRRKGTAETLTAIAQALDIDPAWLLD